MAWRDGRLTVANLRSKLGGPCTLRYGDIATSLKTDQGGTYPIEARLRSQ